MTTHGFTRAASCCVSEVTMVSGIARAEDAATAIGGGLHVVALLARRCLRSSAKRELKLEGAGNRTCPTGS